MRTPNQSQIARVKRLSILDERETDEMVAELVRITERDGTPGQLPGDRRRFSTIIAQMFDKKTQEKIAKRLLETLERERLN
jgi:uncharacterized protein (DUF2236 family)